jgi:NAD+ diphosphatase
MLDLERAAPASREGALHIVFQRGRLVMDMRSAQPFALSDRDLADNDWEVRREQFIGYWQGRACFAVELDDLVELDDALRGGHALPPARPRRR